jgi:hypothetical protein
VHCSSQLLQHEPLCDCRFPANELARRRPAVSAAHYACFEISCRTVMCCTCHLAGHEKSVTCCAWSGMYKMAISGGADRLLVLWNPFSSRPLGQLAGHVSPLVAVAVNEREHQVISAATDKTIKVRLFVPARLLRRAVPARLSYSPCAWTAVPNQQVPPYYQMIQGAVFCLLPACCLPAVSTGVGSAQPALPADAAGPHHPQPRRHAFCPCLQPKPEAAGHWRVQLACLAAHR